MTYQEDSTIPVKMLEQIAEQGLDGLPELIGIVVNAAMRAERQRYLKPHRTSGRHNGERMPTAISRSGFGHELARSPLLCRKCERGDSTQRRWRKGCGANGRQRWHWQRCMRKESPGAG